MFPDPHLQWHPYPSIIDGIRNPFAINKGQSEGKLHLLVIDDIGASIRATGQGPPVAPAFVISILCDIYLAVEEMLYSTAGHGDGWQPTYIRQTHSSRLIAAIPGHHPMLRNPEITARRPPRHFCFPGNDYCYETFGFDEPVIRPFASVDEGYAWVPVCWD